MSSLNIHSRPRLRICAARIQWCLSLVALVALSGCSASPSISVLGAYFPDWMFCFAGALLLTLLVRAVLSRLRRERLLEPAIIAYPALMLLFSLLIWLLIFNS